jgi:hypothetical protein
MQSDTWKALLDKIPTDYHHSLLVVTSVGLEVSLQAVLRREDDYLIVRGRLAGTTDTGRIFIIPYSQINLLCIQKSLAPAEVRALFGETLADVEEDEDAPPPPDAPVEAEVEDVEKTQPIAQPPQPPSVEELPRPAVPPRLSKAELLARIRSRSLGGAGGPPADQ